ncbi:MAG: cytochrome P450 [Thermoleophilaceae bacterium]|nr:cytochrome P450 [Thermoleophilaceae bacterium]
MSSTLAATAPLSDEHRLPPGPRAPRAVNAARFLLTRRSFMRRMRRRYGDAFTLSLPAIGNAVVVSRPELVKAVFTADAEVLHGGKNPLGEVLGPGSLFSMDEGRHLDERRRLLPAFHGDRMRSYDGLIEEEALRAMAAWPEDEEFATLPAFNRITLRVILRAVFGAEGAELAQLEAMLPRATALGQRLVTAPFLRRDLGRFSPGGRFRRSRERYDELVGVLIDKHLADPHLEDRIDILALMLCSLRESGEEIDRAAVADELLTLLVAGHETTASSLAWAVERLRRHPEVVRRLEEEVAAGGSALRTSAILELQRHRTIIGATGRRAMQTFQLGEWRVPAGTVLITSAELMHEDDGLHPHPWDFDPDRYVDAKPGTYSWIPFGGGRRRCLGAAFALFEMDVVLRTLLSRFELVPASDAGERESFRGVAYAPAKGGLGRVRRRRVALGGEHEAAAARCPVHHAGAAA